MIINNLYPLDDTMDAGYPDADKEVELTSRFGVDPVLSMDAYWLGYIAHDTLPMQYCCAMVYQEEDTEDVIIKEITDKVNFPCGYVADDYGRTQQYRETIYQNADGTETYPSSAWAWLFNTNFPEYSGLMYKYDRSETCLMSAYCYIYNQGDQLVYPYDDSSNYAYMTIFHSGGDASYIDEIYKFLFLGAHYDATAQILEGGEFKTLHFDITADLFEDGTAYISDTTGNYSVRLYLAGFHFGEGAGIAGEGASGPAMITFPVSFTVKTSESYNDHHNEHIEKGSGYHEYYDRLWYARYGYPTISDPQFLYGVKADIRIPKNEFNNIRTVGTYLFQDGVLIHKNDGRIYISGINTIDDIKKSFSLYYRVCRENIASYVADKTYATDVSSRNEFLARLKTGDIQDNNFKKSLRPWQYGNFNENSFEEKNIPSGDEEPFSKNIFGLYNQDAQILQLKYLDQFIQKIYYMNTLIFQHGGGDPIDSKSDGVTLFIAQTYVINDMPDSLPIIVPQELNNYSIIKFYKKILDSANEFSEYEEYTIGDYVSYNNNLYRCKNTHNGPWNSDHFIAIISQIIQTSLNWLERINNPQIQILKKMGTEYIDAIEDFSITKDTKIDNLLHIIPINAELGDYKFIFTGLKGNVEINREFQCKVLENFL